MITRLTNQVQVGQTVQLRELEHGFEVLPQAADQPAQKVIELGPWHIVFDNESDGIRTRVPSHLLKFQLTPPVVETLPQAA